MRTVEEALEERLRGTPLLPQHLLRLSTVVGAYQTGSLLHKVRDLQRLHLLRLALVDEVARDVHLENLANTLLMTKNC